MNELIPNFILALISTLAGFIFGRRRSKAEAQGNEIDNVEKALKLYRDILHDFEMKMDIQDKIIKRQEIEILTLQTEIQKLKKEIL